MRLGHLTWLIFPVAIAGAVGVPYMAGLSLLSSPSDAGSTVLNPPPLPERKPDPPAIKPTTLTKPSFSPEKLAREFRVWVYLQSVSLKRQTPRSKHRKAQVRVPADVDNTPPPSLTTSDAPYQEQWHSFLKKQQNWENAVKRQ